MIDDGMTGIGARMEPADIYRQRAADAFRAADEEPRPRVASQNREAAAEWVRLAGLADVALP